MQKFLLRHFLHPQMNCLVKTKNGIFLKLCKKIKIYPIALDLLQK